MFDVARAVYDDHRHWRFFAPGGLDKIGSRRWNPMKPNEFGETLSSP
jgi:hypothetical protein